MSRLRALWSLVKPRIVALLCLTGASGLFAAGGASLATVAGFLGAGAAIAAGSAALNCWYDRDLDRAMDRTADRPLPSGDLDPRTALSFAVGLLALGTAIGWLTVPLRSVGYMWLGVLAYVGVYTVGLKRRHPIGVVIGGSAGSFPVLAGWSVVAPVGVAAVLMAALVFVWTPAHAWALAYVYRDDFAAAGVPTLPAVAGPDRVRRAVWYSALVTVGVAALVVPFAGPVYLAAVATGTPALVLAYRRFRVTGTEAAAVTAFFTSNTVLAALFLGWAVGGAAPGLAGVLAPGAVVVVLALIAVVWAARPELRGVRAAPVSSGLSRSDFGSAPRPNANMFGTTPTDEDDLRSADGEEPSRMEASR